MDIRDRIGQFMNLISCSIPVPLWVYDQERNLIYTSMEGKDAHYLQNILEGQHEKLHLLDDVISYAQEDHLPLLLSAQLGLIWGATVSNDENHLLYIIGPALQKAVSFSEVEAQFSQNLRLFNVSDTLSLQDKYHYIDALSKLTAVSAYYFQDVVLMLHYAVNEVHLSRADLHIHSDYTPPSKTYSDSTLRTWNLEKLFMELVRSGDMEYSVYLSQLGVYGRGMNIQGKESTRSLKIHGQMLAALYAHAAIEGGLTPDMAYHLADDYLQRIENSDTVTALLQTNREMLGAFVTKVHETNTRPVYSVPVQCCIDWMECNTRKYLDIDALASEMRYTKYYLSRKFKAETGLSMSEYMNRLKIKQARQLLDTSEETIEGIAATLGFCSGSYFAKIFQKVEGISPAEYRNRL